MFDISQGIWTPLPENPFEIILTVDGSLLIEV